MDTSQLKQQLSETQLYEDLSLVLRLFKQKLDIIRKNSTNTIQQPDTSPAHQLIQKYRNFNYQNPPYLLIMQRFMLRLREIVDIRISKCIILNKDSYYQYLKNLQFWFNRDENRQSINLTRLLNKILLDPIYGKQLPNNYFHNFIKRQNSELQKQHKTLTIDDTSGIMIINKSTLEDRKYPRKQNQQIHAVQQKILNKHSLYNCLGVEQNDIKFLLSQVDHTRKSEDLYIQMKYRNRFIANSLAEYQIKYEKHKKKLLKKLSLHSTGYLIKQQTELKRSQQITPKTPQIYALPNHNKTSLGFVSKSNKPKQSKSNREKESKSLVEKPSETLLVAYYKRENTNIIEKEDILDPKILLAKIQKQNLYQLGKVNFAGGRIQLCPQSWDNNSNGTRKRVFYRRAVKDNYKSKISTKERVMAIQYNNRQMQSKLQIRPTKHYM